MKFSTYEMTLQHIYSASLSICYRWQLKPFEGAIYQSQIFNSYDEAMRAALEGTIKWEKAEEKPAPATVCELEAL